MTREREEITKEEAVEILKDCELNPCVPKDKEAADMAIKALEQEPCEDCISRAEAIKGLGEQPLAWTDSNSEIQQLLDWREHKEMLERLPSVGQKVGHWIVEIWNNREHHTCSECQRMVDYEPCYHYCPYCGAKLSEVEE